MAEIFKSKFTGEQIETLLEKTDGISVQSGATEQEFESITIEGKTYHLPQPTDVAANPAGEGQTDLSKLKVGDTIYNIPKPTEPTTVIANPVGTPTGSLEKLQVGNDIYEIPIEANPDEPAIGNLDKLRVGQGIYSIPSPTTVVANPTSQGASELERLQVGDVVYDLPQHTVVQANPTGDGTVILSKLKIGATIYTILSGGAPIEISTEAAMNAVLEGAQIGAIFKYVGTTTDTYENGALYVVEEEAVNLISFSIEGGFELQAEDGMTWGEYVNSTYNSEETGIVLSIVHNTSYNTDYVVWVDDSQIISTNSTRSGAVKTTDVIVANTEYTFYYN